MRLSELEKIIKECKKDYECDPEVLVNDSALGIHETVLSAHGNNHFFFIEV